MENNPFIIGAVFFPLGGAILSLILRRQRSMQRNVGLITGIVAFICSLAVLLTNLDKGPQIYRLGDWLPPYGIVLVGDMLASLFAVMASAVMVGGLLYARHCKDKSVAHPAFLPLFLTMETGLLGALYTGDIFTLFVFMELMVISSVSLVAISDNELGLEAALKYVFISSIGSLFLLLGIAALYATFGTLNLADIAQQLGTGERPLLARAAAIMLMSAFLLKSAVFPFHFWQPDFHTTAPTPVGSMLSSIVVKVGIYGIIRLTTLLFTDEAPLIQSWLIALGLIGIFFGGLGALRTHNGKRMLAYSTFGQIGFILLGIGWGTPLALIAALIYAFNHAFIKSSLLMLVGVVSSHTQTKTARLTEMAGVGKHLPTMVGVLYLLGGMALAGIPPMNGFISKLVLVRSGIEAEEWLSVGLAVSGGIITLLYMTRTWQLIFQQKPTPQTAPIKSQGGDSPLAPAILLSVSLLLGLFATPLYDIAHETVVEISNPQRYIDATGIVDWTVEPSQFKGFGG